MPAQSTPLPLVAQDANEDLRRDAGLRGERFENAAWALSVVFVLGLAVLAFVLLSARRRRSRD